MRQVLLHKLELQQHVMRSTPLISVSFWQCGVPYAEKLPHASSSRSIARTIELAVS